MALIAGMGRFFFGPRKARTARLEGGVQHVEVTVRGGYSPDVIRVRQGVPVELVFDRQESGECTNRVVFPDLRVSAGLPAYARTTVRVDPAGAGSFGFACGMNMIHGTMLVEPDSGEQDGGESARDGGEVHAASASGRRSVMRKPPRRRPPSGTRRSPT